MWAVAPKEKKCSSEFLFSGNRKIMNFVMKLAVVPHRISLSFIPLNIGLYLGNVLKDWAMHVMKTDEVARG
jgi:hypothetical protein